MNSTFTATDAHTVPGNSVPGYGGTTIQPLQNYFLYPGNR